MISFQASHARQSSEKTAESAARMVLIAAALVEAIVIAFALFTGQMR